MADNYGRDAHHPHRQDNTRTVSCPQDGGFLNPLRDRIEDVDMKRTFERIVSAIHLDDDVGDHVAPLSRGTRLLARCGASPSFLDRGIVPDLNSPGSSSTFSFTPRSSPNHGTCAMGAVVIHLGIGYATTPSLSPSRRRVKGAIFDPTVMGSPLPLSTKSFLDDDWLWARVQVDSNMALVAGGLVRSSSTPPASAISQGVLREGGMVGSALPCGLRSLPSAFGSNRPPKDYICKLCSVPGHWLKDCHLFEPRDGATAPVSRGLGHTRTASMSLLPAGVSGLGGCGNRGQPPPPGNYICRLCGVPGHWIEQCTKFQPKNGFPLSGPSGRMTESRLGVPPSNYVCNLCHQPGHWIQQCSEFKPLASNHHSRDRRSLSSERNTDKSRFF